MPTPHAPCLNTYPHDGFKHWGVPGPSDLMHLLAPDAVGLGPSRLDRRRPEFLPCRWWHEHVHFAEQAPLHLGQGPAPAAPFDFGGLSLKIP